MPLTNIKKHLPYLGLVFILYISLTFAVASIHNWYDPPFSPFSDLNLHIPRAFKIDDPSLFVRDPAFQKPLSRLDTVLFPLLLSKIFPIIGGIWPTLIIFSFVLGLVFVIGIYWLTYYLSDDPLAGVIAALLGSLDYMALGVQLGFTPEFMLPRNFIVALSPILIALFLHWSTSKKLWILYALLGLMANFHTLAALHLVIVFTITLIAASKLSWSLFTRVFVGGVAALIFALPAVASFLPLLTDVVTVSSKETAVILTRYRAAIKPDWELVLLLGFTFLPIAAFGGWGFYRAFTRQKCKPTVMRIYLVLYIVILLMPWVGVTINSFTLSFTQLEMMRITRYYFLLNFAPIGMLLAGWAGEGKRTSLVSMPAALIVIMIFSRPAVGASIIQRGLDWFMPKQDTLAEVENEDKASKMVWNWEAFSDLSRWAASNTPIDALFLTPVDWNQFRVYARRGLAVGWKGTSWPGWAERYTKVQALYNHPEPEEFVDAARTYNVDYIVAMPGLTLPGMDIVYENEYYVVYKAR